MNKGSESELQSCQIRSAKNCVDKMLKTNDVLQKSDCQHIGFCGDRNHFKQGVFKREGNYDF